MNDREMLDMLAAYMGKGFLENIEALFKQEPPLARFIADLISSENIGVRLGTTALVEDLALRHRDVLRHAVPRLRELLKSGNPTTRGDSASLLGTIGDRTARPAIEALLRDEHAAVRDVAQMALDELDAVKHEDGS